MAFVRSETHSGGADVSSGKPFPSGRAWRWAAISAAGIGLAGLTLSAVTGLVLMATSLASSPDLTSHASATPDRLALAATLYSAPMRQDCASGCAPRSQYIVQQAKSPRGKRALDDLVKAPATADVAKMLKFEHVRSFLTPDRLAAAFTRPAVQVATLDTPFPSSLDERLYPAGSRPVSLPDIQGPASSRFGPKVAEIDRSSRLAMALAGAGEIHIAYASEPAALVGTAMPLLPHDAAVQMASLPSFDAMPDSVPLPARRPRAENPPAAVAEVAPQQPAKPARRSSQQAQRELAYASPDDGAPSVGQAFKNLFSSPGAGNGVAVYDISAQTVTMPNGQVLEAHSGIGQMADDPRYANQKMNGPTPPNTYRLKMRESRFHGVEAIRMLPVDGKKKYGRDGILAHSYLLRGRKAQSHGCVAFADYDRFLKAFKQGKVTHMVVVPGRKRGGTQTASNGRRG